MTFKEFYAFAKFVIMRPGIWIPTYRYDKDVDALIDQIVTESHEVCVTSISNYEVTIKYKDSVISIWRWNRWYAYMARGHVDENGRERKLWDGKRPSRYNMWRFHELFDVDDGLEDYSPDELRQMRARLKSLTSKSNDREEQNRAEP